MNHVNKLPVNSLTALTILFVALKLTNYISWSWWLVLAPLLVPYGIFLFICAVVFGVAFAAFLLNLLRTH